MKILEEIDTLVSKYSAREELVSFDGFLVSFTFSVSHSLPEVLGTY